MEGIQGRMTPPHKLNRILWQVCSALAISPAMPQLRAAASRIAGRLPRNGGQPSELPAESEEYRWKPARRTDTLGQLLLVLRRFEFRQANVPGSQCRRRWSARWR